MTEILGAALLSMLMLTLTPASADDATWSALPCTQACWVIAETPCTTPPPEGTYADIVTPPAPEGADGRTAILEVTIRPIGDWDLYLCSTTTGGTLGVGANILGEPCDNALGPNNVVPMGCEETASTPVQVGQTVIVRAVNIAGEPELHGSIGYRGA